MRILINSVLVPVPVSQIAKNVGCAEDIFSSLFVARINDSFGQSAARIGANNCCSSSTIDHQLGNNFQFKQ